jgi:hypothetical protein
MTPFNRPKNIISRWYDIDPEVAEVVYSIQNMKPDYQEILGQLINMFMEKVREEYRRKRKLIELGPEKHMGLLKSQTKRRWYDKTPTMYRAFNNLYVMDDQQRNMIAKRLHAPVWALEAYFRECLDSDRPESATEIKRLIELGLTEGVESCKGYLLQIGLRIPEKKRGRTGEIRRPAPPAAEPPRDEVFIEHTSGMHLQTQRKAN